MLSKENPSFHKYQILTNARVSFAPQLTCNKSKYIESTLHREFGKAELAESNFVLPSPLGHVHLLNVLLISLMLFERSGGG